MKQYEDDVVVMGTDSWVYNADCFADVSKMIAMPESDAEVACSYRILLNCQGLLDGSKESYMHYLHNISLAPLIYYFRNEHI